MANNHDLTYYPDWLVANVEGGHEFVLFLCLQNRFETFDKDAELLEREFGVTISRIHPRDCDDLSFTVPACRVPATEAADLFRSLIKQGHKVAVCEAVPTDEIVKSKQLDFYGTPGSGLTKHAPDVGMHSAKSGTSKQKKSTVKAADSQPPQVM